jgi:hypothetical protein
MTVKREHTNANYATEFHGRSARFFYPFTESFDPVRIMFSRERRVLVWLLHRGGPQ